ncbi:hypothetical protein BKA70DRAFT_1337456 [Coprinopsis sp. MPI-PUGE-AT-0042]|nr:hypothetical protein BKA70DRAFT_1337456 [Coprinopsis sp. MPI-PUGE-AT-0042]
MTNDLFDQYKGQYDNIAPAAGLFFHGAHYALRVEAPTLGKEFTDSSYIGSDPEGFLYYNDVDDFKDHPTSYNATQVTNPRDGKPCALITFRFSEDTSATPYAVFLAYDPVSILTQTYGSSGYASSGVWNDLKIAQTTATVQKTSTGTQIILTTDVIGKKAVITAKSSDFHSHKAVHSRGSFSFKSIKDLNYATTASYNKDRVVFYTNRNAKDFVGYFIPFEGSTASEIEYNSLGSADTEFSNVVWSDI